MTLTTTRHPWRMPRKLGPVLFGLFDIASGASGLADHNSYLIPGYRYARQVMPLTAWWVLFTVVGVLILTGTRGPLLATVTASLAVFVWVVWAMLVAQAHGPTVSARGIELSIGLAVLHALLFPYRRRE